MALHTQPEENNYYGENQYQQSDENFVEIENNTCDDNVHFEQHFQQYDEQTGAVQVVDTNVNPVNMQAFVLRF
jgi:hypothetical protein